MDTCVAEFEADTPYMYSSYDGECEANPRASRTVPFVSKAIGHPLAMYVALLMLGKSLQDNGFTFMDLSRKQSFHLKSFKDVIWFLVLKYEALEK